MLGSLTSLIAGLFLAVQFHAYLNNFLIGLGGRFNLTKYPDYKKEVSKKKEFSSTLEEFYGNLLILVILFLLLLSYIIELLLPNLPNSNNPLGIFKPPLMRSNVYITFLLGLFSLFMVLSTIKSFNAWRNRLNYYAYYQYYQENRDLLNKEQNEDVNNQRTWLNDYRMQFSANWDRAEELYNNRKYELLSLLKGVIKKVEDFPQEYQKRIIPENIRKFAEIEPKNMVSKKHTDILNNLWRFWTNSIWSTRDIYSYLNRLRLKGTVTFLDHELTRKFLDVYQRVENAANSHKELSSKMEKLIQSKFIFKSSRNEIRDFNDNEARVYKQILLIEQFPDYNKFLEDFFNTYKPVKGKYRKSFKPLVSSATFKFLELEEEKFLSVVIEENVSTRKLHLELLENLNNSVSNDLEILNRCLDELKTKKRNKVIQFFSRL